MRERLTALEDLAGRNGGPVATAVALALVFTLPIALSLQVPAERLTFEHLDWQVPGLAGCIALVALTVVPAAVVSGAAGGWVRRRHRVTGAAVALAVAWALGVTLLPIVAAAFGVELRTAFVCIDGCVSELDSGHPLYGMEAAVFAPLIGIVSVLPPVLGACAWLAAQWLVRRRRPTLAVAIVTVAYGALVWPTLLFGGFPVYACLAVGIVTWSRWLDVREARRRAGRSLAAPAMVVAIAGGEPAADDATAR